MYEICSIPPKKETAQKKTHDFVESLIGAYLNPVIVGKVIITILERACFIRLHDPLFSSVLVFRSPINC